jgi:hypothetical protein
LPNQTVSVSVVAVADALEYAFADALHKREET